jgi:hypothetical protein
MESQGLGAASSPALASEIGLGVVALWRLGTLAGLWSV